MKFKIDQTLVLRGSGAISPSERTPLKSQPIHSGILSTRFCSRKAARELWGVPRAWDKNLLRALRAALATLALVVVDGGFEVWGGAVGQIGLGLQSTVAFRPGIDWPELPSPSLPEGAGEGGGELVCSGPDSFAMLGHKTPNGPPHRKSPSKPITCRAVGPAPVDLVTGEHWYADAGACVPLDR